MPPNAPQPFHPTALPLAGSGRVAPRARAARPPAKGQQTRSSILDAALALALQIGLEGLSIGAVADVAQMSKSGVFSHFGSREELQLSVVREYHARFEQDVFHTALKAPRGLPRLRALFEGWVARVAAELDAGCIYISGAVEFDDRPGPVRDALVGMVLAWHAALQRAIRMSVDAGHLPADTDPMQVLFELQGAILSLHHDTRFLHLPGALDRARQAFEHAVALRAAAPPGSPAASPAGAEPRSAAP